MIVVLYPFHWHVVIDLLSLFVSTESCSSWRVLICCSLASPSSADSAASCSVACCSLATLSSADSWSAVSLSLICCSLTSLTGVDSVASRSRRCCRPDVLCSTVWAAHLALSLILRTLKRSSLCSQCSSTPTLTRDFLPAHAQNLNAAERHAGDGRTIIHIHTYIHTYIYAKMPRCTASVGLTQAHPNYITIVFCVYE